MERDGDGENLIFRGWWGGWRRGCAGGVRVWVPVVVVCQGERLQPYKLQGCNLISLTTGKEYLFTCFVRVCYCVVWVFLYLCGLVPFRGAGWVCRWGVSVGVLVWLVVPVVVEVGRAIPPSSSV